MMIAACVLVASTANTADAAIKQIEGIKKIASLVGKRIKKTSDDAAKVVWNNKGAIAVGTIATIAVTNPEAATAAVTGTADIVTNAVTGTADVAYGAVTSGRTADIVAPRANARPSSGGSIIPTLLLFLAFVGIGISFARRFLFQRRRIGMWCVALLAVGILFCCVGVADAASPVALAPAIKPLAHFAMWIITAITIFL
jgi:hypothetical protein